MDYIGGMGYGERPCANCETEPAVPGGLYCDELCRAEAEGWTEDEILAYQEREADRFVTENATY